MKTIQFTFILLLLNILFKSSSPAELDTKKLNRVLKKDMGIENFVVKPIKSLESNRSGEFFQVYTADDSSENIGYLYSGRVQCCRSGGCGMADRDGVGLENEYFDYFIYYDRDKKVKSIKITTYEATYGHEVTAKSWLKQFIGFDGKKELRPGKEIDGISGATISVYAITADVEDKTKVLQSLAFKD